MGKSEKQERSGRRRRQDVKQDKNKKWYPVDKKGNKIWDITEHCNSLLGKKEPEVKKE